LRDFPEGEGTQGPTDDRSPTLLLVPVLYSIFVLDLKIIRWEAKEPTMHGELTEAAKAVPQTA
jgi:hypothetical protein